jgi:shikimate kinase
VADGPVTGEARLKRDVDVVVLIGFMGAGKSTIGPLLARRLGWRFVDLDNEIERRTGAPIAQLFRAVGEAGFRRIEAAATQALAPLRRTVLATGGGWMLDPQAVDRIGAPAVVIWLRISLAEARARLARDPGGRPLVAGDAGAAVARLLREREPAYARADHIVDVEGRSPAEIVDAVAALIGSS